MVRAHPIQKGRALAWRQIQRFLLHILNLVCQHSGVMRLLPWPSGDAAKAWP
jgi:hypothetical protein